MSTDIANASKKPPVPSSTPQTPAEQWSVSDIHNENPQADAQPPPAPSSKSKRRVRFPEDDSLVVGYLDPFVPTSDNCTSDELISAYIASCKYYKVAPIEFLLEQLRGIDLSICNERYSRLSLKGVRFSRLQVETMEEVFRRVHFREIDLEDAYLDEASATALFDIMLHYESCIDLSISFSLDRTVPSTAWQRCVAYLRKSSALRYFKLSHTPLAVHHFMGLNLSGLSLEKICFRDCNLSGAVLFELVRWLRYLMTLTESSSIFMGGGGGSADRSGAATEGGSQKSGRNGSRRYPRLAFRGPQVAGLWALSLHLPENRITAVDAETLLSLIRHQLVILPGPPTPCKARNGVTEDSPEELQVENRPIGGSGYLVELNLAQNNFRDEGVNILCTGLLQAYRMQQRRLEVATAAIAEATEGKKVSQPAKSTSPPEDAAPAEENAKETGETTAMATTVEAAAVTKPSARLTLPPSYALPSVRGLERLCLSDNGLTALSARDLAHVVAQSTERMAPLIGGLTHLDLSNNPGLGDAGVEALCEGLIKNCTLRELLLRNVRMGFGGIFALSGYLSESRSLVLLDIRQNSIDLAGIMALTKTMTINESLTSLLSDARNPLVPVASKDADLMQTFIAELDNCLRRNRHSALQQKSKLPSDEELQPPSTNSDSLVHINEAPALSDPTDGTNHLPGTEDHNASEAEKSGVVEDDPISTDPPQYQSQSPVAPSLSLQQPDQLVKGREEEGEIESEQTNPPPAPCEYPPGLATSEGDHVEAEDECIQSPPPSSHWPPLTVDEYEDYVSSDPLRLLEEGTSPVLSNLPSFEELERASPPPPQPPSLPILLETERAVEANLSSSPSTDTKAKVRRISEVSTEDEDEDGSPPPPQLLGEEETPRSPGPTEKKQEAIGVESKISQACDQEIPSVQTDVRLDATAPTDLARVPGSPVADEIRDLGAPPAVSSEGNESPAVLQETATADALDSPRSLQCALPFSPSLTPKIITLPDTGPDTTTAEVLTGEASNVPYASFSSCEKPADSQDHPSSEVYPDVLPGTNKVSDAFEPLDNRQTGAGDSEPAHPVGVDTESSASLPDGHVGSDIALCGTYNVIEPVYSTHQLAASVPVLDVENVSLPTIDPSGLDSPTPSAEQLAASVPVLDVENCSLPTIDSSGADDLANPSTDQVAVMAPLFDTETRPLPTVDPGRVESPTNPITKDANIQQQADGSETAPLVSVALDSPGSEPSPSNRAPDGWDHMAAATTVDGAFHYGDLRDNPMHSLSPDSLVRNPTQEVDLDLETPPGDFQASTSLVESHEEDVFDKLEHLSTEIDAPTRTQVTGESDEKTHEVGNPDPSDVSEFAGLAAGDNKKRELKLDQRISCSLVEAVAASSRTEAVVNLDEDQLGDQSVRNEAQTSLTPPDEQYAPLGLVTKPEPDIQEASKLPWTPTSPDTEYQEEDEQSIEEKVQESLMSAVGSSHCPDVNTQSARIDEPSLTSALTSETTVSDISVEDLLNRTAADSNPIEEASLRPLHAAGSVTTDSLPDQPTQTPNNAYGSLSRLDNTIEHKGYPVEHCPPTTLASDTAIEMSAEPSHLANQNGSNNVLGGLTEEFLNLDPWPPRSGEAVGEPLMNTHEISQLKKSQEDLGIAATDYLLAEEERSQQLPCTPDASTLITGSAEVDHPPDKGGEPLMNTHKISQLKKSQEDLGIAAPDYLLAEEEVSRQLPCPPDASTLPTVSSEVGHPPDKGENSAPETTQSPFAETAFAPSEPSDEVCMISQPDSSQQPTEPVEVLRSADNRDPDLGTSIPPQFSPKHNGTSVSNVEEFSFFPPSLHGDAKPSNETASPTPVVNPHPQDSWDDEGWSDFESEEPQPSTKFEKDATQTSIEPSNTPGLQSSTASVRSAYPVSALPDEDPDATTGKSHVD